MNNIVKSAVVIMLSISFVGCADKTELDTVLLNSTKNNVHASKHCDEKHDVYVCGKNFKVVSAIPERGNKFYSLKDGSEFQCGLVTPSKMSPRCRQLVFERECKEVCGVEETDNEG